MREAETGDSTTSETGTDRQEEQLPQLPISYKA